MKISRASGFGNLITSDEKCPFLGARPYALKGARLSAIRIGKTAEVAIVETGSSEAAQ